MSIRNLAIGFMVFMLLAFVAIIMLFMKLNENKVVISGQEIELTKKVEELESAVELLEVNKKELEKYKDSLKIYKHAIIEAVENQTSLNIGINYEKETSLKQITDLLRASNHDIYYEKKVASLANSFVIYYNDALKTSAEDIAEGLNSKTSFTFRPLKGRTPKSITQADIKKTILIHIKG